MKAAIFNGGGKPLTVEVIDEPKPGPGDVIIKVRRCGICGTDLHLTAGHGWSFPVGTILGHEYAGEVVEVGSEVLGLRKGDLITALPCTGCGECEACIHGNFVICSASTPAMGGFAEYARVPSQVAIKLPSVYSAADGALVEPFAVGLYGVRRAQVQAGDRVLVLGGGSVALTTTYWARRLGAGRVVALSRSMKRAQTMLSVGAHAFIQSSDTEVENVVEALGGPPDIVFECVGVPGMTATAVNHVKRLGKIIAMGFCAHPDPLVPAVAVAAMKGVQIIFPVGYTLRDFQYAADALHADAFDVNSLVTSVVPLADIEMALERLRVPNNETKIQLAIG